MFFLFINIFRYCIPNQNTDCTKCHQDSPRHENLGEEHKRNWQEDHADVNSIDSFFVMDIDKTDNKRYQDHREKSPGDILPSRQGPLHIITVRITIFYHVIAGCVI